jgi:hypothetical protein
MAKRKTLNLKAERKRLLENCHELVQRFYVTRDYLRVGEAAAAAMQPQMPVVVTSGASVQAAQVTSVSLGPPDILTLVQAGMIQEWQVYLDNLFEAVVIYSFEVRDYSRLSSMILTIDITDIDAASLVKMRQSIATSARERFSFQAYDQKTRTICGMFGVDVQDNSVAELRKHVEIRNIFQHSRGIIRASDTARIGKGYFEIRDAQGIKKYGVNDRIVLTTSEVEHLESTLGALSKNFEVLK